MPYIDQFLKDYPEYQGKDEQALAKALYDSHFSDQGSFEDFKAEFLGTGSSVIQDFVAGVVAGAPKLVGGILGLPAAAHDTAVVAGEAATGNRYQNDGGMVVKASRYAADKLNELGNYLGDSLYTDEYTRVNKQFAATPDKGNAFSLADWRNGNNVADMTDTLAHLGKNPTQVAGMVGESLPSIVAPIVAARAASVNGLNATRAAIAAGAGLEGSSAATDARDRVMKLPEEVLAKDEVYQAFLEAGYAPELAREAVALRAGGVAFPIGAGVSAVSSKLLGAGKFEADIGTGSLGTGKIAGAGRGLMTETPQEFLESGASAYAANEGVKQFGNEQQSRSEGVLKQATQGAVAGGIAGAGMGLVSAPKGQPSNFDYANATPEQLWGNQPIPTVAPDMRPDIAGNEGIDLTGNQSNQAPIAQDNNKAQAKAEEANIDAALKQTIQSAQERANQQLNRLMPQDPELQVMAANGVPVVEITPESNNVPTNMGQSQNYPTLDAKLPDIASVQSSNDQANTVNANNDLDNVGDTNVVESQVIKPEIKLLGGNTPFKTVKSAELGQTFKTTPNARVVPVEGGYGVVDGKAWDDYEAAMLPQPEDTAYGRLEQQRIQANNMAKPAPTVPEVDVEAAYRQREAELERQKQIDYAEAQAQAAEQEYQNILKLQSETPIENTALRKELASKLMDAEIKRLMEIENRQQIMESGNPRLVEAGIEEMQGEPTPELPMLITPELEQTYQVKLPENFTDPRLADDAYRVVLGDVMEQSITGGGVQLIPQQGTGYIGGDGNEYGQQVTRTKSMNSPITQALIADGYKADEVRNALDAALKGQKLGKRWQGLVTKALDYSNADAADIQSQMAEFEQNKAAELDSLGYGDTINAPFAPDNAQPVSLNEQAKARGGAVLYSRGGKTGGIAFAGQSKLRTDELFKNNRVVLPRSITTQTDKLLESGELLDMPQVDVPVADIVPTQSFISQSNIEKLTKSTSSTNAELAKIGDKYYVLDGHHRIAKRIANGDTVIQAHVAEIDAGDVKLSFAGRNAKTANLDNLANAEARIVAGEDKDVVRQETGWHQGVDGKWRFEIDDSGAGFKKVILNQDEIDIYTARIGRARDSLATINAKEYSSEAKKLTAKRKAISLINSIENDKPYERHGTALSKRVSTVGELIDHPALFEAYPAIADIKVEYSDGKFVKGMDAGTGGYYNSETNTIALNVNVPSDKLFSIVMHEIQHAIQQEENFARGGSPSDFRKTEVDLAREKWASIIKQTINDGQSVDEVITDIVSDATKNMDSSDYSSADMQVILELKKAENPEALIDKWSEDSEKASDTFGKYQRLAGETEARNTQKRMGMNAQKRKLTAPWKTQDVADDNQIVRFGGGRAEMAVSQATFGRTGNKPNDFVTADGSIDFWVLPEFTNKDDAKKFPSKPVRLKVGRHIKDHKGFGFDHVREQRKQELDSLGMSADRYVHSLLNSTYRIYDEGNGTLQLEAYGSPSGAVITALEDMGDYYHVITAYDAKKKKGKLIWSGRNQVVSNQQNAIGSKVQAGQTAISTTLGSSDKPTPLKRNTGILNQNPALGVLGTNEYGVDNTTPLSTVNDISAELSNDVSTKRLLANGKLNVVQSVDDLPAMIAEQVKRSVAPTSNTIIVDGVERSTRNSNGQLIAQTEQGIINFWRWFGDSKVVDADGKPMVVYHYTPNDVFEEFDRDRIGETNRNTVLDGFFFADKQFPSSNWNKLETYLKIENAYDIDVRNSDFDTVGAQEAIMHYRQNGTEDYLREYFSEYERYDDDEISDKFSELENADGAILRNVGYDVHDNEFIVFEPSQIKSAISNNGNFDPNDNNILRSQDGQVQGLFDPATGKSYLIADNLKAKDALGVAVHEVGVHAWLDNADAKVKSELEARALTLVEQMQKSPSKTIKSLGERVAQRLDDAGETSGEEALAYTVETVLNEFNAERYKLSDSGILNLVGKVGGKYGTKVANFISDVLHAFRAAMAKAGWLRTGALTAADFVAVAKSNMRELASSSNDVEGTQNNGDFATSLASFASDKPTAQEIEAARIELDKQLSIADKLEAEYGYLPAPNGERSNLNKQQWAQVRTPQFKEFYGDWENESGRIYREMDGDTGSALNTRTEGASSAGRYRGRSGNESVLSGVREGKQLNIEQVRLDDNGEPRIYYHGTKDSFDSFDTNHPNRKDKGWLGRGVYVAGSKGLASMYARQKNGSGDKRVLELFVAVRNPYIANPEVKNNLKYASQEAIDQFTQDAIANGYDGVAVQYPNGEVELVSFDPKLVKSATDNIGTFSNKTGNINFSKQGNQPTNVAPTFTVPEFGLLGLAQQKLQNNFNRIQQIQEAIVKQGGKIDATSDVYKTEERFWGKVGSKAERFTTEMKQLVTSIADANITLEDMENFLYARHAIERNAFIRTNVDVNNDSGSGMTDKEASTIMADMIVKHPTILSFANQFDDMTMATRKMQLDAGLISKQTFNAWNEYKHYVPLKGWADAENNPMAEFEASRTPAKKGFDVRGAESKSAKGRKTLADALIENMYQQRLGAIVRAGQNEIGAALFNLVNDNPNADLWEINAIKTNKVKGKTDLVMRFATEQERDNWINASGFNGVQAGQVGGVFTATVKDAPTMLTVSVIDKDKTLALKVGGREVYIKIKDAPLLEQMLQAGVSSEVHPIIKPVYVTQNWLKRFYTSLNPEFSVINFARDLLTAFVSMPRDTGNYLDSVKFLGNLTVASEAMKYAWRKDGKKITPLMQRYLDNGGTTGFMDFQSIESITTKIDDMWLRARKAKDAGMKDKARTYGSMAWAATLGAVEKMNEGLEVATRLAAFKTAIDAGKTDAEAASIAKNITVNFNRKGDWAKQLDLPMMFFNPAIQGTKRVAELMSDSKSRNMLMGLVALGFMTALMAGDEEDEAGNKKWDIISDERKMKTLPFGLSGDSFATVQMPYGVNFFTNTGFALADVKRWHDSDGKHGKSPEEAAEFTLKSMALHLNSFGGLQIFEGGLTSLQAVMPAVIDPIIQVGDNKNWAGKKLRPEQFDAAKEEMTPDSQKFYAGQEDNIETRIAGWLSRVTGGDGVQKGAIELAPSTINVTMSAVFGGLWNVGKATATTATKAIDPNQEVEAKDVPVVRKMVSGLSAGDYSTAYREKSDKIKAAMGTYDAYIKDGQFDKAQDYYRENLYLIEDSTKVKAYDKELKSLRTQRNLVFAQKSLSDDQRKTLLEQNKKQTEQVLMRALKGVE